MRFTSSPGFTSVSNLNKTFTSGITPTLQRNHCRRLQVLSSPWLLFLSDRPDQLVGGRWRAARLVVALTSYPMIPHNPLQDLRDLDRTSTQFHEELSNIIHGHVYRDTLPSLRSENLTWLVEYLDGVSFRCILRWATINIGVGSIWRFRPEGPRFPRILARTQNCMRHQGSTTKIVYTFGVSYGMCV